MSGAYQRIIRPIFAALALALMLRIGGVNWWIAGGAAYALLNVLWAIWAAGESKP